MKDSEFGFRFVFDYDGSKRLEVRLDKDADMSAFFDACRMFALAAGYNAQTVDEWFKRD